jgi:hypothetical protein
VKRMQAILFALVMALVMPPALASGPANQISGLWDAVATPNPGGPVANPILTYTTMGRDGTMVVVDSAGPSAGAWQRVHGRTYVVSFRSFLELAPGWFVRAKVESTVELSSDGQKFSGPFRTSVSDLDGNFMFDFEGTVEANRISISGY